jgi:hypothetical protein
MDDKIFDALYYDLMDHCVAFTRSTLKEFIDDDDLIESLCGQIDRDMAYSTTNLLCEIHEIDELDPVKLSESLGSEWADVLDATMNDLSDDVIETVSKSEADSLTWPVRLVEDGSIRFESESLSIIKSTLERIEH